MHVPLDATAPTVRILGTHGVPAAYGGFETAAQAVGLHLRDAGWRVVVYCQDEGRGKHFVDSWNGLETVHIPIPTTGWLGTARFDLMAALHAGRTGDPCLVFGYNTAIVNLVQRLRGSPLIFNMDGIEWSRSRWGPTRQAILFANEWVACRIGDALIADHPEVQAYLARKAAARKLEMITYGGYVVDSGSRTVLESFGLSSDRFATVICRIIPENSVLEIVKAFSMKRRGINLVVVGDVDASTSSYHREVLDAASDEVRFIGPQYDDEVVASLRYHSRVYLHGHTVGGVNPSLVEAMAAGNPIIAQDNVYNRWTAPASALFFDNCTCLSTAIDRVVSDEGLVQSMRADSRRRHSDEFTWTRVAGQYEQLLRRVSGASPALDEALA